MSIVSRIENGVFTIEIARPEKKNAFTNRMYTEFADCLSKADADAAVAAVLIQGQADIFSAGNDMEDFAADAPKDKSAPVFQMMYGLVACMKPVIAAVRGPAVGIGATLLLHCDLVFLADDSRLSMPFVSLALVPEFGSSWILPRLAGAARAAEYLLLGAPISAAAAVASGIANHALPAGDVVTQARAAAERFNRLPAQAVRATKQLLRGWTQQEIRRAIDAEADVFLERLRSAEAQAAFKAFLQKRPPQPR